MTMPNSRNLLPVHLTYRLLSSLIADTAPGTGNLIEDVPQGASSPKTSEVFWGFYAVKAAVSMGQTFQVPTGRLVEFVGQVVFASSNARFLRS